MSQRIVILGSGESGTGAALLAKQKGFDVFVSDKGSIAQKYKDELLEMGVAFEEGMHTEELILNATEVIKSPGIPEKNDLVKAIRKAGIPIINELEFAARYTSAYKICITGTNGKTTTTSLVYHLLQKAGLNVAVAGNIGISMCRMVATGSYEYYVLEISSFQLDDMYDFKADMAIICNITPDHLDRYEYELQNYVKSKFRITRNQDEKCLLVYCADDELTINNLSLIEGNAKRLPFSHDVETIPGAYIKDQQIVINLNENQSNQFTMYTSELTLRGRHNAYNSMAAAIIANALEIRKDVIREGLMDFQNVEHRLEYVATVRGVDFINDSKATNVNSAWYALESMDKPVIWVVGGVDKGNDYNMLKELVKSKVRIIVCLGVDNARIHEAFSTDVDMILNTSSAQEAVHVAAKMSKPGETVLLSPACASFDLFKNYEDRGRQFKAAVRSL
ncbi:MAG: UDP-N-acetylmuramoyl-L-alanine--D-glutamate ligase [Bacteroidetes bacterium B1(2017)]|nr:MAG: UDP-N-acetylmuramoyl-L-alanine--D-glutamate ligase [Bacteroidetes bacterium B1(2017)]